MALGGKTVQYTLQVDLETGKLTAGAAQMASSVSKARASVEREFDMMSSSARGFGSAIAAVFGLLTLRQAKQFFRELVGFATEHQTSITAEIQKMKIAYNAFLTGIVESPIWGDIIRAITSALSFAAVLIQNHKAWTAFWDLIKVEVVTYGSDVATEILKRLDFFGIFTDDIEQTRALTRMAGRIAAEDFNKAFSEASKNLRVSAPIQERSFIGAGATSIPGLTRDTSPAKQFEDLNLAIGVTMPNLAAVTEAEEDMRAEMIRYGATSREELSSIKDELNNMLNSGFMTFINGMVAGFESVGAAIVNGQNAFKSFGAIFLKTIAQLAVQFGTFLILVGTGMSTVGTLFGFSGAGAVAAGIALTIFGGALGALASRAGAGSNARTREQDQRFRDSNFNTSGGNGGTTIINNFNFANTIGLTRDSMKEVGEVISAELFKQGKLGRIETVG
jgi:hypothetical protein